MPRGRLRALNPRKSQSIFRISGREAKTAPAPTTFRHISRQAEPPGKHFHPPQTKSPSQYRQSAPIPATIPFSGGRNRTGRVKTSPIRGAAGKRYERGLTCAAGHGAPECFYRASLDTRDIDERKREAKTAPARGTSRHIYRQTRQSEQQFRPPQTKSPSQYRQTAPITTTFAISGGRNCTGRVITSLEGDFAKLQQQF